MTLLTATLGLGRAAIKRARPVKLHPEIARDIDGQIRRQTLPVTSSSQRPR
jgi:hypothetical protein